MSHRFPRRVHRAMGSILVFVLLSAFADISIHFVQSFSVSLSRSHPHRPASLRMIWAARSFRSLVPAAYTCLPAVVSG
eukprot:1196342-Prymnesium_polylepis.1